MGANLPLNQGFSFDVFYTEEHDTCEPVEWAASGVRSGCRSHLFQWFDDRAQLYGEGSLGQKSESRVTV
jgi:hypothetical protein